MTTTPLLRLDGLTKSFGKVTVARDLTLSVGPGEALGIVGPNGAGKSSLFAMISGDLRPDGGTVWLDGREITRVPPHVRTRAGIGRTHQVPRPFEHLTVFENVLVCGHQGAALKGRRAWGHAMEVLDRTGLASLANIPAGRLTLLQRKRLEVARAMGTRPRLLLLDEVAGGLTEPEVLELVGVVRRLHADGLGIVWIEHVVHALVKTVGRMVCLAGGAVVADDAPLRVLADAKVRELYLGVMTEEDAS
ncbi:branched-chain amino acid transport system ATP-binding protein [Nonomuraea solani]|uniref:Branched-chain amino acid transport system ATP-binding protein n=1 Tax=Nonomuraea solani TaxID=1144553 RepID=A0A1H6ETS1_9ACTN|nr:ATP-binding cassette domain-containing protein [Nonomuraea solani]SEH01202.1 branched-chain amino acid transport system ATP-binding protein [Nonomuraea solani]